MSGSAKIRVFDLFEGDFFGDLHKLGFQGGVAADPALFNTHNPGILETEAVVRSGSPLLLRSAFINDPAFIEMEAIEVIPTLDFIDLNTNYDIRLITQHLNRVAPLRTLYTNLERMSILPDERAASARTKWSFKKVAVLAHVYYVDMVDEIMKYASNVPAPNDVFITTDSVQKKAQIEEALKAFPTSNVTVRVMAQNRGRDMSALFIALADIVLSGDYDLCCRVHTKKSPQAGHLRATLFKEHTLESALHSPGYVAGILDLFEDDPTLGLATPPIVQVGFPTLGHAWFNNREKAEELKSRLDLRVPFDQVTPIAPYGTMYWFRPNALRKMFATKWEWSEYNEEPFHSDGGLAHAQERIIGYCVQDAGCTVRCIFPEKLAAKNYVKMEYKLQLLGGHFDNGLILDQVNELTTAQRTHKMQNRIPEGYGVGGAIAFMMFALAISAKRLWAQIRGKPIPAVTMCWKVNWNSNSILS